jgi:hypothetical protein
VGLAHPVGLVGPEKEIDFGLLFFLLVVVQLELEKNSQKKN